MSARPHENEIDMARRHVRQCEANVASQREHIAWRRAKGMDTELSERVLGNSRRPLNFTALTSRGCYLRPIESLPCGWSMSWSARVTLSSG